ncbi:unnamed protein product (macronuclear) [Paramecium tetraurelia]|uniref:Uncharacterized protein n=1 Tax=Paramecium tetraurelia TaxID=5888 RepID=A0BW52_PARTE|nr:uncharacterized protein GSPATT00032621001 [Paramecium tetraurelia]CAK62769.1 unnamed protein product [Paramecium tetraurelia]|eukprot:XP_001430167.1 hypothetical protein (macronuclear) [Paramecium tetraurelia strain d4-2]
MQQDDKKIDFIPVPKKNQIIVPYDCKMQKYDLTDNDIKILFKYFKELAILKQMRKDLSQSKSLNPYKSSFKKIALKILLQVLSFLILLLFIYLWIGLFIVVLADPIIMTLYSYLVLYLIWYKGIRLGIEMMLDYGKLMPLQKYLKSMNKKYFGSNGIQWHVGGGGKWIQIDYLTYLKK